MFVIIRDLETNQFHQKLTTSEFMRYCKEYGGAPQNAWLDDVITQYNAFQQKEKERFGSGQYAEISLR